MFARAFTALLLAAFAHHGGARAELTVTDDFGNIVTLDKPAMRIVSLAPHNTENLFSAGAGDKVVAVDEHSDYPPAARRLPSIGSHAQVNIEALIALAPDLVVAWETAHNREALKKIARLGYPVYYSEPRAFEDIIENIEELALLAGSGARITPRPATLRDALAQVRARYADKPVQTVFYQVWSEPLMTLGGDHFISRALKLCGARNLFAELSILAPQVSIESVVQANPDIIISARVRGRPPDMSLWRKWRSINAVARDGFVFVDADVMHRHTARMLLGIGEMCAQIDRVRGR